MSEYLLVAGVILVWVFALLAIGLFVAWRYSDRKKLADALTQAQESNGQDVQTTPDQDARIQEQTEPLVRAYLANEMTERDLEQALLGVCENVQGEVTEKDRLSISSGMKKLRSQKRLVRAMPGGTKAARKHARKGAK